MVAGRSLKTKTRWWFQIFCMFIPYLGKISILTNIFQMGWFNHQEENRFLMWLCDAQIVSSIKNSWSSTTNNIIWCNLSTEMISTMAFKRDFPTTTSRYLKLKFLTVPFVQTQSLSDLFQSYLKLWNWGETRAQTTDQTSIAMSSLLMLPGASRQSWQQGDAGGNFQVFVCVFFAQLDAYIRYLTNNTHIPPSHQNTYQRVFGVYCWKC